jgi:hypothetical protein
MFSAHDFLAELTQHIPPKSIQYIRRYGLYASRTRGKWNEMPVVAANAPEGWKAAQEDILEIEGINEEECEVTDKASRKAWARLLAKVYEIDPLVCPKCGSEMRVIAVIKNVGGQENPETLEKDWKRPAWSCLLRFYRIILPLLYVFSSRDVF